MPRIGHWRIDTVTGDVTWDDTLAAIWGLAPQEAPRTVPEVLARVHPDDAERIVAAAEQAPRLEAMRNQYRVLLPDGTERWVVDEGRREGDVLLGTTRSLGSSAEALERYALLLEAGQVLDQAQDRDEAVRALVDLVVARLGDVALVALLGQEGPALAGFAAADEALHAPLARAALAPAWDAEDGLAGVLRTGRSSLRAPADEAFMRARAVSGESQEAAAQLAGLSFAAAPLLARGRVIGAISQGRRRTLGEADLALLEDLGRRAGLAIDALTRLEHEQELRRAAEEARARLDELVRAAPIGIASFGTDLRYLRMNAKLEEINGLEEAAHLGRRPSEVLPGGGEAVEAALREVLATGEPFERELAVRLPGSPDQARQFVVGFYRVALPGGEPLGVGGTVFEVTDRNEARAALEEQRDLYARLLEAQDLLGEGVFVVAGPRFEWANEAVARLAGRSIEQLTALPSFLDVVAPDDRQDVAGRMIEVLTGGEAVRFDARLSRPDGREVWVELAGRALMDDGEPRVIGVGRDIDERKQAELERERTHRRTALLADLAGLLEASLDLRALLGGAARLLVERGVCEACAFDVPDGGGGRRRVAVAPERADLEGDEEHALVSGGREVGTMIVDGARDPALAAELAARVAPVVVNAQLYEERVRVARVLQESLLPPALPEVPGVEVATRYAPGAARLDVGGDFYDLFASAPGVWNAVVGDVCGKGAEAAALTALARHTLRALAVTSTDPADLLGALNAAIRREGLPGDRFITMVLARLVPREGGELRLDFACAGHPPPLVARVDGEVEEVPCAGPLLGVQPAPRYRTRHVDLRPGELAVLFTDGLSEAARAATGDGYRAVPGRLRRSGAEAVAAGLEQWAVDARGGGEANDDLALLVIGA